MQKLDKKASILIWAIMLSIIVAISFISINTKINKSIKLSGKTTSYLQESELVNQALYNKNDSQISDTKVIVFENDMQRTFSLKQNEEYSFIFSGTNPFNIDLGIIEGGGVKYSYRNGTSITHSGVLNYAQSFSGVLSSLENTGILHFNNLGGYSKIHIKSELNFESLQKKYKILQKIGNNSLIESRGSVTN